MIIYNNIVHPVVLSRAPLRSMIIIIIGKTDSIHHHHLKGKFETATVPELRQTPVYTNPSGWWWCIESVFRIIVVISFVCTIITIIMIMNLFVCI